MDGILTNNKKNTVRTSIRRHVTESFRNAILTGKLKPGSFIPSTQKLALQYGTREANIHHALTVLVKEGMISRRPGVGTIVNEIKSEMRRVVVYLCKDFRHPNATYLRLLLDSIENELNQRGIECFVVYENNEKSGLNSIKQMVATRGIQGIIMPGATRIHIDMFNLINVPFSCLSTVKINNRVRTNRIGMLESVFKAFKALNCHKIAILSSSSNAILEGGDKLYTAFQKMAKKNKMDIRPEWSIVSSDQKLSFDHYGQFAFDGFKQIWSCKEKPDGLFVYTDDLIVGTLMAIMQKQVHIPDDLKLVMHRNVESPIICPVPCFFIENNIKKMAIALVSQVFDLYHGKTVKPITIDYNIKEHKG